MPIICCKRALAGGEGGGGKGKMQTRQGSRVYDEQVLGEASLGRGLLTAYATNDQHFSSSDVCHRSLRDFDQHRKYGLL